MIDFQGELGGDGGQQHHDVGGPRATPAHAHVCGTSKSGIVEFGAVCENIVCIPLVIMTPTFVLVLHKDWLCMYPIQNGDWCCEKYVV